MPTRPRVLVIDDDPDTVALITYLMGKAGITVIMARSTKEGMNLALANPPDLIVCDLNFNGENGYQFGERMSAEPKLKLVPRIILTNKDVTLKDHEIARESGYLAVVQKPARNDEWAKLFKSFMRPGVL